MSELTEIEIALNNFELAARWVDAWVDAENYDNDDNAELDKRLANRQSKREHLLDLIRKAVKK